MVTCSITNVSTTGFSHTEMAENTPYTVSFTATVAEVLIAKTLAFYVQTYWGDPHTQPNNWCVNGIFTKTFLLLDGNRPQDWHVDCYFCTDPVAPAGTYVATYLIVVDNDTGLALQNPIFVNSTYVPAHQVGTPYATAWNLPAEVLLGSTFNWDVLVTAAGGTVTNPVYGVKQISGPQVQAQIGGSWVNIPTGSYAYSPILFPSLGQNASVETLIPLRFPSDPASGGKQVTLELIAGTTNTATVTPYPPGVQKTTYIKAQATNCTAGDTRCVDDNEVLGGCNKEVCVNNAWVLQTQDDPTCPECGCNKHCGTSAAGTIECGHTDPCNQDICDGCTGTWKVHAAASPLCGTNCTPCPTEDATYCDGCKEYKCKSGTWLLSSGNSKNCGETCGATSNMTLIYAGVGVAIVGAIGAYYIIKKRKQIQYEE
jgi:hypothetical protein